MGFSNQNNGQSPGMLIIGKSQKSLVIDIVAK